MLGSFRHPEQAALTRRFCLCKLMTRQEANPMVVGKLHRRGRRMRIFMFAAMLALSGCKTNLTTDLFTSDLISATEGETLTAPLVVGLEASSTSKCQETSDDILAAVQTLYAAAEFIGCDTIGFDTFSRFRVQSSVIGYQDAPPIPDQAFAIGVRGDGTSFDVSYLVNVDATRAIWDALPEELTKFQTFKLSPRLSVVLNNDLATPVTITTDDVFADGTPIQGTATRTLERRGQIELTMSDVTNAAFGTVANASHIVRFQLDK